LYFMQDSLNRHFRESGNPNSLEFLDSGSRYPGL
jgi:hypothetical protein